MGMLINSCKKNDSPSAESLVLGKLARHLYILNLYYSILEDIERVKSEVCRQLQHKMNNLYTNFTFCRLQQFYHTIKCCDPGGAF